MTGIVVVVGAGSVVVVVVVLVVVDVVLVVVGAIVVVVGATVVVVSTRTGAVLAIDVEAHAGRTTAATAATTYPPLPFIIPPQVIEAGRHAGGRS